MGRPKKQIVDYFPHFVKSGKTIFILESKFGNTGYSFWFKLLELLCETDGHAFDCSNLVNWAFLIAKTKTDETTANEIIKVLVDLGKIDAELWQHKIIWVQNLVDHFSDVYRKRATELPQKPNICPEKQDTSVVSAAETPQSKVKEIKLKESKEKNIYPYQKVVDSWNEICKSLPKVLKLNDNRRNKIKCRLEEFGDDEYSWQPTYEALFEAVESSDFLRGNNNSNWVATFDWLFSNGTNWIKVMEGNYANKRATYSAPTNGVRLGAGEYIEPGTNRRTYGTGKVTIPDNAPPRPSERYSWSNEQQNWILL